MHRKSELDNAKIGPQVATGLAHTLDQKGADFQAQLLELISRQVLEILWAMD